VLEVRGSDAIGALRWGLGKYTWLFLLYVVALTVLVPAVALRGSASYDAEALVVAQRLDMDLVALPRYGEAVFDNGEVARAIASRFGQGGDFEDIVPQRASLVAEQDSIVLRIVGHDSAPGRAAELANAAADAFVTELNAPGEGVGLFTIQSQAVPPSEPTASLPGLPFLVPVGLVAGAALGLAAVAVVVVVRRPVLEEADAEQATGVPVLASVTLPRIPRGQFPSGEDVAGVVALCRRLLAMDTDAFLLVSTARGGVARAQLAVAAVSVLVRVCYVRFIASEEMHDAARALAADPAVGEGAGSSPTPRRSITVVDGADPVDLVRRAGSATTVLLVPHGMPINALRAAAGDHLGGGKAVLVLVRRGRRRARRMSTSPTDESLSEDATEGDHTSTSTGAGAGAPQPPTVSVGR